MTAILVFTAAVAIRAVGSTPTALGCVVGGAVMIANLSALTLVGKAVVGLAQGGGVARIAVVLAPLKLLLLIAVVYLLITRFQIDLAGFIAGSLTQLVAVFIETGRVSMRARPADQAPPSQGGVLA